MLLLVDNLVNVSDDKMTLDGKRLNETEREVIPYFDIERFSGFTFEFTLPLQYSIKIDKGGFFENIIDEDFYVPIFMQKEFFSYSEKGVRNLIFSKKSKN